MVGPRPAMAAGTMSRAAMRTQAEVAIVRILVVEDEAEIAEDVKSALQASGYVCETTDDGEDAWFLGSTEDYDAIILDFGLPSMDGLTVLKKWRAEGRTTPVIVLTARGDWTEKVIGMDAGADDYVSKPFETGELLARLRAVLRRANGHAAPIVEVGPLALDPAQMRVMRDGRPIHLTPLEYRLASYMIHHCGQVLTTANLVEHVYGCGAERDNNVIEALIKRLRKKIGGELIQTRRGIGYELVDPGR